MTDAQSVPTEGQINRVQRAMAEVFRSLADRNMGIFANFENANTRELATEFTKALAKHDAQIAPPLPSFEDDALLRVIEDSDGFLHADAPMLATEISSAGWRRMPPTGTPEPTAKLNPEGAWSGREGEACPAHICPTCYHPLDQCSHCTARPAEWRTDPKVMEARKALLDADDAYYHEMPTDGHRQFALEKAYRDALDALCAAVSLCAAPPTEESR